jgi:uncharacterized protein (UPF0335 family)
LRSLIERVEHLEEEKKALTDDIAEVFKEAKGHGFDVKIMRDVIRIRKRNAADRQEYEAVLELYLDALGMLRGTPLGEAAIVRLDREMKSPRTRFNPETGEIAAD